MKKIFALATLVITLISCKKDPVNTECRATNPTSVAPQAEKDSIRNFISSNSIANVVEHSSGVFYVINEEGSGTDSASVCNYVDVDYVGTFFNGTQFDKSVPNMEPFILGDLIDGWKYALPKLRKGGKITMYIPPALGYGYRDIFDRNNNLLIPKGSYLKFEVTLKNILK